MKIRVAFAQLRSCVWDFEQNVQKIEHALKEAEKQQVDFLLSPELFLCGYPPYDLLERSEFYEKTQKAFLDIQKKTQELSVYLVLGHIERNPSSIGRFGKNVLSVLSKGKCCFKQVKTLLPTYDIFDEARYFEPATQIQSWNWNGMQLGFSICEDLWYERSYQGKKPYREDPFKKQISLNGLFSIAASPYERKKIAIREQVYQAVVKKLHVPLFYVNQVGATDEILFDGSSFVMDAQGQVLWQAPAFEEGVYCVDFDVLAHQKNAHNQANHKRNILSSNEKEKRKQFLCSSENEEKVLFQGLCVGIKEYFQKNKFQTAMVGLSGGLDSTVVAALAVEALGREHVVGIAMPGPYSSSESLALAQTLASSLGIELFVQPIKFFYQIFKKELSSFFKKDTVPFSIASQNLQARLRGLILMFFANAQNALVLNTSNKSELTLGYSTLYGDLIGALAPIGDLFKTDVYRLGRFLSQELGKNKIPSRVLERAPTAELKAHQTDEADLGAYAQVDPVLRDYIEKDLGLKELQSKYAFLFSQEKLKALLARCDQAEYKRKQAPPILKVSSKAFGIGRRVPISKHSLF